MQNQLTQKEKLLLQDEKGMEELCVTKYKSYAQQAQDPQLKQLFTKLASEEQKHYDTVNQLLQGGLPSQGQSGQSAQSGQSGGQMNQSGGQMNQSINLKPTGQAQSSVGSNSDKTLCQDMLATEKYVSGTYDTAVFESASPTIRQELQHIQKDEQSHGEQIFQYMNSNGMYQPQ